MHGQRWGQERRTARRAGNLKMSSGQSYLELGELALLPLCRYMCV